jgi:hypothetical protein
VILCAAAAVSSLPLARVPSHVGATGSARCFDGLQRRGAATGQPAIGRYAPRAGKAVASVGVRFAARIDRWGNFGRKLMI